MAQSVSFLRAELAQTIRMAERQNKNIFIDTYTNYCKPCKQMDKEFRDPQLASYLNKNFINIKVNMEVDYALEYKNDFQIVFLPTLLFLSPNGDLRMSIDRVISAKDLLQMAKVINGENTLPKPKAKTAMAHSPSPYTHKTSTPKLKANPAQPSTQPQSTRYTQQPPTTRAAKPESIITHAKPKAEAGTKILSVMDQDSQNWPPEVLKAEAYHRMQFMDGSHKIAAKNFLATQQDWTTEDNMRFVHDFLDDARSPEFKFVIDHRAAYESLLTKEVIAQSIAILVNKELERAYPRPDKQRVNLIMGYVYPPAKATIKAKEYELNSLYEEEKIDAFITACDNFDLNLVTDANLLDRYSSEKCIRNLSRKELKHCLSLSEKATVMNPDKAIYHYTASVIALLLKEKKKSLAFAKQAIQLTNKPDLESKINKLIRRISEL